MHHHISVPNSFQALNNITATKARVSKGKENRQKCFNYVLKLIPKSFNKELQADSFSSNPRPSFVYFLGFHWFFYQNTTFWTRFNKKRQKLTLEKARLLLANLPRVVYFDSSCFALMQAITVFNSLCPFLSLKYCPGKHAWWEPTESVLDFILARFLLSCTVQPHSITSIERFIHVFWQN